MSANRIPVAVRRRSVRPRPAGRGISTLPAQLLCVLAALALWELVAVLGLLSHQLLPRPTQVASELARLISHGTIWTPLGQTVAASLEGLIIACIIGIPIGILAGMSSVVERSLRVFLDFGRSFPAIALLPVALLLFGATRETKVVIIVSACAFLLALQALYGARRIEPTIAEVCDAYRIPRRLYVRRVVLPSATPSLMTGLRLAATTAVLIAVSTELVAGIPGIGAQISGAQQDGATSIAYAYIVLAGVLGYLTNRAAEAAETHLLRWRRSGS